MSDLTSQQSKIKVVLTACSKTESGIAHQITQYVYYWLMPLPFRILLPSVAKPYTLETL